MKQLIKMIFKNLGYDISKIKPAIQHTTPYSKFSKIDNCIVDTEVLGEMSLTVPGMITPEAGKFLYSLCYMQEISGDVVEIGSWQGRSTTFLARAVKESDNGKFYAIDHFAGNIGKEDLYAVDGTLENLKENFEKNMSRFDLEDVINLFDMVNTKAAEKLQDSTIRFLFIDGDHTKEGVEKDIELFFPRLTKGSIVVFDDYFEGFPGVLEAVDLAIEKYNFSKAFYHKHTLVVQI
jgi:predicted O-methyltransferase YrrM